jgi:putative NIF3 family GTP cyclohydrolase 1 type 2
MSRLSPVSNISVSHWLTTNRWVGASFTLVPETIFHFLDSPVKTIALCAGSGSSVFSGARNADIQLTGELSHHAVLDAVHRGTTVILCEHSNTERGFLTVVKQYFDQLWRSDRVTLLIAERDRDPLEIV